MVAGLEEKIAYEVARYHEVVRTDSEPDPFVLARSDQRPVFVWDGDDLILEASDVPYGASNLYRTFDVTLEVALQWGFVKKEGANYVLGPNCQFELDNATITDSYPKRTIDPAIMGLATFNGKAYLSKKHLDKPSDQTGDTDPYKLFWVHQDVGLGGSEYYVRFSGYAKWRFSDLNDTYNNIHHHRSQAVMVYTNLQQSTIVGGVKAQLLRELVVQPTNTEGHSYTEPLHLQWVPVLAHGLDIVEVQLADVNGNLLRLPKGKSLVTVAIKQI